MDYFLDAEHHSPITEIISVETCIASLTSAAVAAAAGRDYGDRWWSHVDLKKVRLGLG